jgi:dihydrofolate reductase
MKIILHLATSADGFIAKSDGDSNWVSQTDEALFVARVRDAGCVVVGKKTFEQYHNVIYPVSGALNIVLTNDTGFSPEEEGVMIAHSPDEAISIAKEFQFQKMLIAGGAKTAAAFLEAGLIDDVYISVHPLTLGTGLKPFDDLSRNPKYKLIEEKRLNENITELHYTMV